MSDTSPPTFDPDPVTSRRPGNIPIAIIVGIVGGLIGAALGAGVEYVGIGTCGVQLIGLAGFVVGIFVALPIRHAAGGDGPTFGIIAAVLSVAAGVLACLLWMRIGTGKSFETLFSSAERDATMNTFKSFSWLLTYAVAAVTAYVFAWQRSD